LSPFWKAARALNPEVTDESHLAGARGGHLATLFRAAGFADVEETSLAASVEYASFAEWWEPYTLGVGTAGSYLVGLGSDDQAALRHAAREMFPPGSFVISAWAWTARGRAR
jgi:hypothetical protein